MSRKSFSNGIDAILGDTQKSDEHVNGERRHEKNSQKHPTVTRTSIFLEVDSYEQIKAIAFWERRPITSVIQEALDALIHSKGEKYVKDAVKAYVNSQ